MNDPFKIQGPAIVSFSGGRTSAYMVRRILDAHGGNLPHDVWVVFANTGREMPATLDFVRDCEIQFPVPIVWLEYCRVGNAPSVLVVRHNTASRNGEPFAALIHSKNFLPNPVTRFCTVELKIRTIKRWVVGVLGWRRWVSVIGLRADEPIRVKRALGPQRDRWTNAAPLADAGIEEFDVLNFWRQQSFDLRLRGRHEGNCDGCFLKRRGAISRMWVDHPDRMQWWADMETTKIGLAKPTAARFRADREGYAKLGQITRDQGVIPFDLEDGLVPCDVGCGI